MDLVARGFVVVSIAIVLGFPLARHTLTPEAGPFAAFFAGLEDVLHPATDDPAALVRQANRRLQARMDELERALEDGSWLRRQTLGPLQWLLAGWGGKGNEEVYVGYRGWLFYRPGLDYVTGPPFLDPAVLERRRRSGESWQAPPRPDPRPAILDFHRQLRERGIRLVVLPVPTKAMVRPGDLAPGYLASGPVAAGDATQQRALHNPSFAELRSTLEADGIHVFDPTERLTRLEAETRAFLYTDSHWSPAGVDAVARELAERVRLLGLSWEQPEIRWQRRSQIQTSLGDLARTLRLPRWSNLYPPEQARPERVSDGAGQPWAGAAHAEVLLLGDSFTNVYSDPSLHWGYFAGLAEQLSFHLRRGVHRVAVNAAGATGSRELLAQQLRDGTVRLDDKKLVIWEFAVRELVTGDWRPVLFPVRRAAARTAFAGLPAGGTVGTRLER